MRAIVVSCFCCCCSSSSFSFAAIVVVVGLAGMHVGGTKLSALRSFGYLLISSATETKVEAERDLRASI